MANENVKRLETYTVEFLRSMQLLRERIKRKRIMKVQNELGK